MRTLLPLVFVATLAACTSRPQCVIDIPGAPATPAAATPEKPETVGGRYIATDWDALPGWPGDHLLASWQAFLRSCERIGRREDWKTVCADAALLRNVDTRDVRRFFEGHFTPWQAHSVTGEQPATDTGLITGYYEPLLTGGREAKPGRVPLYAVPEDMFTVELGELFPELKGKRVRGRLEGNKVLPYWDRAQIDSGMARAPVLVWVDNAVEAFFLQVQGSGRVQLEDGTLLRVGYADQNGHPYRAIGKWLVEQGEMTIDQVSMQNIKAWAARNPHRLGELLNNNPSYVFFRELPDRDGGPVGALNVPLTDGASIAVDRRFIPLGAPVFLVATHPDSGQPLQRLMHAQDTGGAITGPVRADFFWGYGDEAGATAGKTRQQGRLWLLWPKDSRPPYAP
ncbi:MAG: murein transglycosylase A [Pseudomonadota bacterium]